MSKYLEAKKARKRHAGVSSYAEALKNKSQNQDKKRAEKVATAEKTQVEKNPETMLRNHFKK